MNSSGMSTAMSENVREMIVKAICCVPLDRDPSPPPGAVGLPGGRRHHPVVVLPSEMLLRDHGNRPAGNAFGTPEGCRGLRRVGP